MSKKKDRTPAEIAEVRRQRERRRVIRGSTLWLTWLAVFSLGVLLNSDALIWLGFALSMVNNIVLYGLYEKSLRMITARQLPDYNRIRKLEKSELPKPSTGGTDA